MEQRRLLTFMLTASLIMLGYFQLQLILNPPPPVEDNVAKIAEPDDEAEPADGDVEEAGESHREEPADSVDNADVDIQPTSPVSQQRLVLGSLDPTSPYQMAVYFSNRGAAIERIELNNPRYQDLDDRYGYLGSLNLSDDPKGGCRIGSVAPGSPAALAEPLNSSDRQGLRAATLTLGESGVLEETSPGDRIVAVDNTDIADAASFRKAIQSIKAGETVNITVLRTQDGDPRRMVFRCQFAKRPLSLLSPENGFDGDLAEPDQLSFLWTLGRIGDARVGLGDNEISNVPSLWEGNWQMQVIDDGHGVEFTRRLTAAELADAGGQTSLEMVKRYRLTPVDRDDKQDKHWSQGYAIQLELEIRNLGGRAQKLAYQLDGPTGLPLEGWWYSYKVHPTAFSGAGARDVVWRKKGGAHELFVCGKITRNALDDEKDPYTPLAESTEPIEMEYAGCDAQYFSVVLQPKADGDGPRTAMFAEAVARPVGPLDEKKKKRTNASFRLTSQTMNLDAGQSHKESFVIFAGPKHTDVLAEFGLDDCIVYGWFGMVAKPMLVILHTFYRFIPIWGLCIIMLTVLVRGSLFPLGRKMARNAQKMQELAPQMKEIAEKYKNDLEKRSAKQRELFSKHNYNPFGGCLVMFIQLPIFIGLYRSLSVDIELRQAPFFPGLPWCTNLAGPDRFWHWENLLPGFISDPTGLLGPYLNILPIITCILFLVQQMLFTPPPQDEQQEMQQQIMKIMMLFMGFLFHKVAAGLCVYFIASSLWGIAERKLLPKSTPGATTPAPVAKPALVTAGASSNGNGAEAARKKRRKKQKRRK